MKLMNVTYAFVSICQHGVYVGYIALFYIVALMYYEWAFLCTCYIFIQDLDSCTYVCRLPVNVATLENKTATECKDFDFICLQLCYF